MSQSKILLTSILVVVLFFGLSSHVLAQDEQVVEIDGEYIVEFDVNIIVEQDGLLRVSERIVYDFGDEQRRGILRQIPLTTNDGYGMSVYSVFVTDDQNNTLPNKVTESSDELTIRIGDENVFVTGQQTYVINYTAEGIIQIFEEHDELFWNATGNAWQVPILSAQATVELRSTSLDDIMTRCFTGPSSTRNEEGCDITVENGIATYRSDTPLLSLGGMSIVWGVPPGLLDREAIIASQQIPESTDNTENDASVVSVILITLGAVIGGIFGLFGLRVLTLRLSAFVHARRVLREARQEPIVVQYSPPDDLSALSIGTLVDQRTDGADISSVILMLAVRGYIKISSSNKKDFTLYRLKESDGALRKHERILFEALFKNRDSISIVELEKDKKILLGAATQIRNSIQKSLRTEKYLTQISSNEAFKQGMPSGIKVFIAGIILFFVAAALFPDGPDYIPLSIVPLTIIGIFITFDRYLGLTDKGMDTLRSILGFKEYLELTEKDRLKLLNAPELNPTLFEKYLPYAMVLGVEKQWAKQFEDIYQTPPDWYEGRNIDQYRFVRSLGTFSSTFNNLAAVDTNRNSSIRSRSSSSRSSGFSSSSSSSSGGGFGGGGGGSW